MLYNRYRPRAWADILGQERVVTILRHQAESRQYGHSYLLFGPSGSGKTTTARILAASMLCASRNGTPEPCGECQNCRTIYQSANWDVYEINAADFRGIDAIRSLIAKAYLCPLGSHKVYILDECHGLTADAWDCLLKLLEEPPPHLVTVLTTTNIDKVPETVQSRCQLFPFGRLTADQIKAKLRQIVAGEHSTLDDSALTFVAECAGGNLRAAENQLEQVTIAR